MAKRKRLGDAAACPIYDIKVEPYHNNIGAEVTARVQGALVGIVSADKYGGALRVGHSHVKEDHRRCGLGTKLYTALAKWGCKRAIPLESDEQRSVYSQGFWKKQEDKGRAICVLKEQGWKPFFDTGPEIKTGRGGCVRYRLACPVTDLSDRVSRPRRRPRRQTRP